MFGTQNIILSLVLEKVNPVFPLLKLNPQTAHSTFKMPKAKSKSQPAEKIAGEREEDTSLHGAINEEEAKLYIQSLDSILMAWPEILKKGWKTQWNLL